MIREELRHLSTGPRDLRKFGFLVGGVFLVLAAWFLYRHRPIWPWFLVPGALLVPLAAVAPRSLHRVYLVWMAIGLTLGLCISTIILILFFFLVVTPIALIAKLAGKDFLSRRLRPEATTYWLARVREQPRRATDYEQQY